jgi:PPE-repeat protein
MDFAMLPPEINSARMYAGPGSGPLLTAAASWEGLAAELNSAAVSYQSVVTQLSAGPWLGPSSASMVAAAAPYVAWLHTTAAQAAETANQAKAAAAAYQEAFSSTVPPQVIASNRSLLMRLVATNLFGRNASAIAAAEARYAEMWAQDAAAMFGYAGSSASATALTPFDPPQQNTNPGSAAGQAAAVGRAAGTSAGNAQSTVSSIQQTFSTVPNALQSLATAAPAAAADAPDPLGTLSNLITVFLDAPASLATFFGDIPLGSLGVVALPYDIVGALTGLHTDDIVSGWNGVESWPGTGPAPVTDFPAKITNISPTAWSAPTMSAGLGQANTVGALSVPPSWTVTSPAVRPVALTSPMLPGPTSAVAAAAEVGSGNTFGQMGLAGMAGRAMAGTQGTGSGKDGGKAATARRPAARTAGSATTGDRAATDGKERASQDKPRIVVTGVAARIRQLAKLRDEGKLTDEEYTEQKNHLLGR